MRNSAGFVVSVASCFWLAALPVAVHGHGYVYSPRARNVVATPPSLGLGGTGAEGLSDIFGVTVYDEYCPHCLNRKDINGVCGKKKAGPNGNNNYDVWPIPFYAEPLDMYTANNAMDQFVVQTTLDTYHKGHMELRACGDIDSPTQACFDSNPLVFVEDLSYDSNNDLPALPDSEYPERAYYGPNEEAGGASANRQYAFVYKLPSDFSSGDKILLQYKYVTANSCNPEGYATYFDSLELIDPDYANWWSGPNMETCTDEPVDGDNRKCSNKQQDKYCGELFWNCIEIEMPPEIEMP